MTRNHDEASPVSGWISQTGNVKFLRGTKDEMEKAISAVLCVDKKIVKYCDQFFSWVPETTVPIQMIQSVFRRESIITHSSTQMNILIPMHVKVFIGDNWHYDEVSEREEKTNKALAAILEHFHPKLEIQLTEITSRIWVLEETVCYFFSAFLQRFPEATNHWKLAGMKLMDDIERWGYKLPEDFQL